MEKNKNIEEVLKALSGLKERFEVDYIKVYFDDTNNVCIKFIKNDNVVSHYRAGQASFDNKRKTQK